jgi:hypothetical protein
MLVFVDCKNKHPWLSIFVKTKKENEHTWFCRKETGGGADLPCCLCALLHRSVSLCSSVSVSSCDLPLCFNLLYFPLCYLLYSSSIPYVLPLSVFFPFLHCPLSLSSPLCSVPPLAFIARGHRPFW